MLDYGTSHLQYGLYFFISRFSSFQTDSKTDPLHKKKSMRSISCLKSVGVVLIAVSLLSACGDKAAPPAQLPEAAYVTIAPETRAVENELPGRLESYRTAEVRARVPGIVLKRTFEEGAFVKQGQVLFRIDPRSYQASVQNAKAALSRAEANKVQADLKLKRYKPLVEINAISKQEYDDAIAAAKQASADVESAKATLINNKLDLEYATVTAPISGRIGRAMVTEGALVGQNETTLLATIQQINPIYLNLTQSSAELLKLRQMMQSGMLTGTEKKGLDVTMVMEDGSIYPKTGKLLFSDISVDPTTGELALRALFPNPDNMLLPGMFVRARLQQAIDKNAITVPQQAVTHSNDGSSVMVINSENKAEVRSVKTGAAVGNRWVVLEGLQPGDKVIVEGLQKVRPGAPVNPVEWVDPMAPAKAPAEETAKDAESKPAAEQTAPETQEPAQSNQAK